MNKKILIPVVAGVVAIGGFITISSNKDKNVNQVVTSQRVVTANELFELRADVQDKGIIRKYASGSVMSGGGFEITYVNEQGKLKKVSLNDLYILGDVKVFEGATIVVKKLSNNTLTDEQIKILSYTLNQEEEAAKKMVENLTNGASVEVGFIMNEETTEEEVIEEEEYSEEDVEEGAEEEAVEETE